VALKLSTKLAAYSSREDLLQRMPDFAVRMGFGLHVGWAIEGAIGGWRLLSSPSSWNSF
jgi:hypothetical protein